MKDIVVRKVEEGLQSYMDGIKARLLENANILLERTLEGLEDLSYLVALYGGAALILARVCGSTRAKKYFIGIQMANVFIKGLL